MGYRSYRSTAKYYRTLRFGFVALIYAKIPAPLIKRCRNGGYFPRISGSPIVYDDTSLAPNENFGSVQIMEVFCYIFTI